MKLDSPCKDCQTRSVDPCCHDPKVCSKWAEYTEMMDKDRAKKAAYDNCYREYANYIANAHMKIAKKKRNRGKG